MARWLLPLTLIVFLFGSVYLDSLAEPGTELPQWGSTGYGLVQD